MIVVILAVFCVLAAFLIFASTGHWSIKTLVVTLIFTVSSYAYYSSEDLKGWPTDQAIPKNSMLRGVEILDRTADFPGAIFLWVYSPPSENWSLWSSYPPGTPRSYSIPYTESNANAAYKMKKVLENGGAVSLNADASGEAGDGDSKKQSSAKESGGVPGYLEESKTKYKILNPRDQLAPK